MSKDVIYVVGGRQKSTATDRTEEWMMWGSALIVEVDPVRRTCRQVVEYISPPEACAAENDPSIVFKAGTMVGDLLYVPTQTELLTYTVPDFKRVGYVSLSCFNDVHHVRPTAKGTLLVANTGLDSVVEVTTGGELVREWSTTSQDIWQRFDRNTDYRKVPTTKPHISHPNYVFEALGEIWVTRFNDRDALCLTKPEWTIPLQGAGNHDGEVHGTDVYFSSVDAHVIIADAAKRQKTLDLDLNKLEGVDMPLGWCRGLTRLDEDHVMIGFSRLRPTKFQDNLRWVKHKLGGKGHGLAPTRIAVINVKTSRKVWELDLEPSGMNIVFSVHATRYPYTAGPWST